VTLRVLPSLFAGVLILADLTFERSDGHVDILQVGLGITSSLLPFLLLAVLFFANLAFERSNGHVDFFQVALGITLRRLPAIVTVELLLTNVGLGSVCRNIGETNGTKRVSKK